MRRLDLMHRKVRMATQPIKAMQIHMAHRYRPSIIPFVRLFSSIQLIQADRIQIEELIQTSVSIELIRSKAIHIKMASVLSISSPFLNKRSTIQSKKALFTGMQTVILKVQIIC